MSESLTITRNNKLAPSEDYHFLRKEGIRLIQDLSGKIWTDYNTHDPGITLLEALCYAITDLGYRTSFDIKDILAPERQNKDTWNNLFYTARQVLPCNPVTLNDYRKIIIDTEGVRNAWIEISDDYEMFIYLQEEKSKEDTSKRKYKLTYDPKNGDDILRLRGLYKVFVQYEEDVITEKRQEIVAGRISEKLQFHRNLCEDFISVSSVEYELFKVEAEIQVSEGTDIEKINAKIYQVIHDFFSPPIAFYSLEQMMAKGYSAEKIFEGPLLRHGFIDTDELESSERYKDIHLSDIISLISNIEGVIAIKKFSLPLESQSPFADFSSWINNVKDRQQVPRLDIDNSEITFIRSGDRHRSKGEKLPDKQRVKAIFSFLQSANNKSRLKGTAKDIQVPVGEYMNITEYYPMQNNLPAGYGMTEKYMDEKVDKASIQQAIEELDAEQLDKSIRNLVRQLIEEEVDKPSIRKVLHELMNEKEDKQTVHKHITRLLDEKADSSPVQKIIHELIALKTDDPSLKKIITNLLENKRVYTVEASIKTKTLNELSLKTLHKPLLHLTGEADIAIVRNEYKRCQLNRLDKRKKQTLQLRGFLMVFEQIMADHLSQLGNIRELFSFDPAIHQTYFSQNLQGIQDQESLFIDYQRYREAGSGMIETEEGYLKKRNNILDHLMGRFSESMDKYAFYLQSASGKKAGKQLIGDKIAFLSDYISISNYRGKGTDYGKTENTWNTDNVAGMKKRLCRLTGIKDYTRRFIAPESIFIEEVKHQNNVMRYVVALTDPADKNYVLLKSVEYEFENEAQEILKYILENGHNKNLYEIEGRRDKWAYQLKRATQENDFEIIGSRHFTDKNELESAFEKMLETLTAISQDENFHLLEHILLRPKISPREKSGKKSGSFIEADAVELLPVEEISGTQAVEIKNVEEVIYRFKIVNVKDHHKNQKAGWKVSLLKNDNTEMLVVNEDFIFYKHLTRRIEHIRKFGSDNSNYQVDQNADGYFIFSIVDGDRQLAVGKKNYRVKEDMEAEIINLVNFFSYEPRSIAGQVQSDDDISFYADPYSFQISIFIPSWPVKFRDPTFRHLLEKNIYMETPAHIYPHVYWLDHRQMKRLETAYKPWVEELTVNEIPDTEVVNNLIFELKEIRNNH